MIVTGLDGLASEYLYEQLAELIRSRIESGELPPGRPVPSKARLKQEFGVAGGTVDKAMAMLKAEGLIETRLGKGLYVLPHR
jgi:GntR family transcriptional regulator